jgi:hypothetical protein
LLQNLFQGYPCNQGKVLEIGYPFNTAGSKGPRKDSVAFIKPRAEMVITETKVRLSILTKSVARHR